MSMESKHSPTPWKIVGSEIWNGSHRITMGRGAYDERDRAIRDANAALIVRSVNNHEALVEALTNLETIAGLIDGRRREGCDYRPDDWLELNHCLKHARAAIDAAEKEVQP